MKSNRLFFSLLIIISISAFGRNEVRTIRANDKSIQTIYLSLGRSTILKFKEKPTNVVVGNKNYYNIEYINNDVTIQPLGVVDTNLFIYTESKRTYAFVLKVVAPSQYDDILHIRWKSPYLSATRKMVKKKPPVKREFKLIHLSLNKNLKISINNLFRTSGSRSYLFHFLIDNKKSTFKSKKLKVYLTRRNKPLLNQKLFFRKKLIHVSDNNQARLFLTLDELKSFTFNVQFEDQHQKIIIKKELL